MQERERSDAEYQSAYQEKQREANGYLNQGKIADALRSALNDPPSGCKDQAIKDNTTRLVVSILTAVKDADIQRHVDSLDSETLDTLMKYIFKGFEDGENSTSLLKWHEVVTRKAGLGCIVRALSDRRAV
jgi:actin related protein 2/3 complex subunit 5